MTYICGAFDRSLKGARTWKSGGNESLDRKIDHVLQYYSYLVNCERIRDERACSLHIHARIIT